ncbi:hypothetical protein bthur0011_53220 [Bacillus thuringiensis serovar huazhongensis BGSC 4BD1]|nr:hypothetical protein bthur0011_53220 [Bacillus thuringiensis serovar huazhongensis BGSC 4BD1]
MSIPTHTDKDFANDIRFEHLTQIDVIQKIKKWDIHKHHPIL